VGELRFLWRYFVFSWRPNCYRAEDCSKAPLLASVWNIVLVSGAMFKATITVLLASFACVTSPAFAQWYAGADFLIPTRHANTNTIFQRNQLTGPSRVGSTVLLSEDDLELDFAPAGRITVGNRSGEFGIEGSYLITDKWNDTASVFNPAGLLASPFTPPGVTPNALVDNNTSAIVVYTTQLETAEANVAHRIYSGANGDASLLYGARYATIDESMLYTSTNAGFTHNLLTTTENQMIGPQLGALLEAPLASGMVNFTFKFALLSNSIDKSTLFDGTLGVGDEDTATFMSEIGIDCTFYPTRNLAVRLGYHLLAASQVALATDNLETNLPVLGSGLANVQTDAGVAYHSPFLGMVFSY
jgi:hypothetical protein